MVAGVCWNWNYVNWRYTFKCLSIHLHTSKKKWLNVSIETYSKCSANTSQWMSFYLVCWNNLSFLLVFAVINLSFARREICHFSEQVDDLCPWQKLEWKPFRVANCKTVCQKNLQKLAFRKRHLKVTNNRGTHWFGRHIILHW